MITFTFEILEYTLCDNGKDLFWNRIPRTSFRAKSATEALTLWGCTPRFYVQNPLKDTINISTESIRGKSIYKARKIY